MFERLVDIARRWPRGLLALAAAVGAIGLLGGLDAASRLALGELDAGDRATSERFPDMVVRIAGTGGASAAESVPVVETLRAQTLADPAVEGVAVVRGRGRVPHALHIEFRDLDPADQEEASERLLDGFDAGTFAVDATGRVPVASAAGRITRSDVGEAFLLALPLALLLGVALFAGSSLAAAGALSAVVAAGGSAALLGVVDFLAPVSSTAIGAAALVGAVLAFEHARMVLGVRRDAAALVGEGPDAQALAVIEGGSAVVASCAAALAVCAAGILLPAPGSDVALGCALASILAMLSSLVVLPASISLGAGAPRLARGDVAEGIGAEGWMGRRALLMIAVPLVVGALALSASALRDAQPVGLLASDLPREAPERVAADQLSALPGFVPVKSGVTSSQTAAFLQGRERIESRLPEALGLGLTVLSIAIAAIALPAGRAVRSVLAGAALSVSTVLAALAAAGIANRAFGDGVLAEVLDYSPSGEPLHIGALLVAVTATTVVMAARTGGFVAMLSEERLSGLDTRAAIALGGSRIRRSALAGTALAVPLLVSLALVADLLAVKEFAVMAALALTIDLVLVRTLLAPAAARLLGPAAGSNTLEP